MEINIKLYQPFVSSLNKLKQKYPKEFENINGIGDSQLSFTDFIDNFVDSDNTANSTIDSNANVQSKDIVNLVNEMAKPHMKLLGYNKLFYEMTKKYGLSKAQEMLESDWKGDIFIHNSSDISFRPYCFNYDLESLATKGMFFVGNLKTQPAKHLTTFCDHLLEMISWVRI